MRKAWLAVVLAGCVVRATAVAESDGGAVDLASARDLALHKFPDFADPIDLADPAVDLLPPSPDLWGLNKPPGSMCTSTNICCFADHDGNGCPIQECAPPDHAFVAADNGIYPWGCCEQVRINGIPEKVCCVGWTHELPNPGPDYKSCP